MDMSAYMAGGEWVGESLPILPLESPESVILKFAWFNQITVCESARIFNYAVSNLDSLPKLKLPKNWSNWVVSFCNGEQLGRAFLIDHLAGDDWLVFETSRLRFCPICLGGGYHTWWHQCLLHATCLVHGCLLTVVCAFCKSPVNLNAGPAYSMRRPYACSLCSSPISGTFPTLDDAKDIESIRPVLISRYAPWVSWLNNVSRLRNGWWRLHKNWYSRIGDERLYRKRARRELDALLSVCAPPEPVLLSPSISVSEIKVTSEIRYDPGSVLERFVTEVRGTFNYADECDYLFCAENFSNGLRIRAGHIGVAPLSLWILQSYVDWCRDEAERRSGWRSHETPLVEAWVMNLSSPIGRVLPDSRGFYLLLVTIYAELIEWLGSQETRKRFDLEFDLISLFPGFSAHVIADKGSISSVILARPKTRIGNLDEFQLIHGGQSLHWPWLIFDPVGRHKYLFDCLSSCTRASKKMDPTRGWCESVGFR